MSSERSWAIVTGGANGIGADLVKQLSDLGQYVLVIDKNEAALNDIMRYKPDVIYGVCRDITSDKLADDILEVLHANDNIKYLVHNAAHTSVTPFGQINASELNRFIEVNCTAPLMITQCLRDRFVPGARIIHLGTNLAHRAELGYTGYCVSKAALFQLHRQFRVELAGQGVLVTSVRTGAVDTDSFRKGHEEALFYNLPMGVLETRVIDQGMLFTSSEAASFLKYILFNTSDEEYLKPTEWDAYDKSHWEHWRG